MCSGNGNSSCCGHSSASRRSRMARDMHQGTMRTEMLCGFLRNRSDRPCHYWHRSPRTRLPCVYNSWPGRRSHTRCRTSGRGIMRRATECGVVRDHSLGVYGPNARSANTEAAHDIVHPFYMLQGRLGQRIFAALLECLTRM